MADAVMIEAKYKTPEEAEEVRRVLTAKGLGAEVTVEGELLRLPYIYVCALARAFLHARALL